MNTSNNNKADINNNNIIKLKIDALNINGEGLSLYNNKKVCVKNVLPGEEVLANILMEKSNFILAKKQSVINKSPLRITPECPYYEKCGGCDLQHLEDFEALKIKKEVIANYLSNFYSGQIKENRSPKGIGYRNKMSFFVNEDKVGLIEEGTNKIVEIESCLIASGQINNVIKVLKSFLQSHKSNLITHFVVRELNDKFILTVVCKNNHNDLKELVLKLIENLKNNFMEDSFGVYINLNKSKNQILGDTWNHVFGLKYLTASILDVKFCVHPYSFLQVNFDVMEKLYMEVVKRIDNDIVIEGYSGAGLLSCIMAKRATKVISVEINKSAAQSANQTKKMNGICNLENINADCKNILPRLTSDYPNATFVVDPARSGCDRDILVALNKSNIKKIIYISCNPYTLKQNLGVLSQTYKVKDVQIFDMFPKTSHIETLVCLEKI